MAISFRSAQPEDWEAVSELLEEACLPLEGAKEALENFVLMEQEEVLVGCAGWERYGEYGLLRSVAIRSEVRSQGLGRQLLRYTLEQARRAFLIDIYLLTTTAPNFFAQEGFQVVSRASIPLSVKGSVEFQGVCPESATVMRLAL
jgi:amino-acid N-acetyltransferase